MVSDRLLLDVQYAHVGNNFILDFHDRPTARRAADADRLDRPQRPLGRAERDHPSGQQPDVQHELLPAGRMGGDHAFKFGGYWRDANSDVDQPHRRLRDGALPDRRDATTANDCAPAADRLPGATSTRDGYSVYDLTNFSAYVQDTITHGRADAAARPPLRLQPRQGAGAPASRRTRSCRTVAAGDQLRRRRPGRRVQQLLAAPRPDLRPAGQRQDPRARQLRALLRPGRHRRRRRPDQPGRRDDAPLPVGRR